MNICRRIMAINYQLSEAKKMNRAIIISFPNDAFFLFCPQISSPLPLVKTSTASRVSPQAAPCTLPY